MGQVKLSVFCTFYTIAFASLFIYEAKVSVYTEATFHRCSVIVEKRMAKPSTLLTKEKVLWYFAANIAKFFETTFVQNIYRGLILFILLLEIQD